MRSLFVLFLLIGLSVQLLAQQSSPRYSKIRYFYIIDNVNSETQLNELKSDFLQIKGVDEVKFEYKPERHKARAIIHTTQKVRQSEADEEFRITDLKAAILRHGMMPTELTEELVD